MLDLIGLYNPAHIRAGGAAGWIACVQLGEQDGAAVGRGDGGARADAAARHSQHRRVGCWRRQRDDLARVFCVG
jgi:hypothetical protein